MTSNTQIHDRSLSRHGTGISIKSGGVERSKIDTPNKQIHDRSLFWHGTGTSIKSGGIKLFFWAQTYPISEKIMPELSPCERS